MADHPADHPAHHAADHTDDGQLPFYGVLASLIFGLGACGLIALHLFRG